MKPTDFESSMTAIFGPCWQQWTPYAIDQFRQVFDSGRKAGGREVGRKLLRNLADRSS